ncbi:MAG: hypothetical protein JNM07_13930 [Phycisphaerae bacterium]|nr:hypothetical protein [Phycisphaerae bacterium]
MFANDRDLLVLEPNLFRDAGWAAQRLVNATGSVAGATLTVPGADLVALGVGAGNIALLDGVALEVVARESATTLTVSRIRAGPGDPLIPPPPATDRPVAVWTFLPQLAIVHEQLLRMLGIEPGQAGPGALTESSVTNPRALALAEALGALHLVFAGAGGSGAPEAGRAGFYAARYEAERRRVGAAIDLDGDGHPDCVRRLNVTQVFRV